MDEVDYLEGMGRADKIKALRAASYTRFLRERAAVTQEAATVFRDITKGCWGVGWDALSALEAYRLGMPGTTGLGIGKLDEAEAVLNKVLGLQPGNPNANWILSNVRKATDRKHIERLQDLVLEDYRNPRALAFLYFGLGKELEDLEEWDAAFAAFARGAKARRGTIEFDERAEIDMFRAFGETFTAEWFAREGPHTTTRRSYSSSDSPAPARRSSRGSSRATRKCIRRAN